jgi:hypothetical protein
MLYTSVLRKEAGRQKFERRRCQLAKRRSLTTKTVQGTALSLESVDNIEGCDRLALGVFSVCDCISDDALEERLEDTTGLFIDH